MKKILLICAGGFSTGFLIKTLNELAKKENKKLSFEEGPSLDFSDKLPGKSLVCVAPQIKFRFADIEKQCKAAKIKVYQIQPQEYVPMNAAMLIKKVEELV